MSANDPKQTLARQIAPASARETRMTLRNAHARGPVRALACRRPRSGQSGTDAPSLITAASLVAEIARRSFM
jgi:hypothetical protein